MLSKFHSLLSISKTKFLTIDSAFASHNFLLFNQVDLRELPRLFEATTKRSPISDLSYLFVRATEFEFSGKGEGNNLLGVVKEFCFLELLLLEQTFPTSHFPVLWGTSEVKAHPMWSTLIKFVKYLLMIPETDTAPDKLPWGLSAVALESGTLLGWSTSLSSRS